MKMISALVILSFGFLSVANAATWSCSASAVVFGGKEDNQDLIPTGGGAGATGSAGAYHFSLTPVPGDYGVELEITTLDGKLFARSSGSFDAANTKVPLMVMGRSDSGSATLTCSLK